METTIMGYIGIIWYILGLYGDKDSIVLKPTKNSPIRSQMWGVVNIMLPIGII